MKAVLRDEDPETSLRRELGRHFPGRSVTLHASGRDALRVAFVQLAAETHRREIAIPAYACFSIPAAAVAAGLRVRLVDVDNRGQLHLGSLEGLPLETVAAVVVTNLFGVPEPVEEVCRRAAEAGTRVVDDAAQTFGGRSAEGWVGDRGDLGVLSFGRSKPVSALGGGALLWNKPPPDGAVPDVVNPPKRGAAVARAMAYDLVRIPLLLRGLAAIPALGIGKTEYDPEFPRGPMPGAGVALAAALLPELEAMNRSRAQRVLGLAHRILDETDFVPLLAGESDVGVYPRMGIVAPTPARRDAALVELVAFGATGMYPTPLGEIPDLGPHLVGETRCPGAEDFCRRVLTLPAHAGLGARRRDWVLKILTAS